MLGDDKSSRGQIMDLSFLYALGLLIDQRTAATLALLQPVNLCVIGLFDHLEGMARMSGLSSELSLPSLTQAFGRGFVEAIARGRLAAVAGVPGELLFQMPDPLLAQIKAGGQSMHLLLQRMDACVHFQQHAHHDLRPGMVNARCFFTSHHAHNCCRKSGMRGYR